MDAITTLLDRLSEAAPASRTQLRHLKVRLASETRRPLVRNDALLGRYREEVAGGRRAPDERLERLLMLNAIRSESGVATVTVITKPYACPGRCVYCPTEVRAPKSYLPNEPAVMRALRHDYDPYEQVTTRLRTLHETGHATDKIELIIKGGTWSFYPQDYQRWFVQRCFDAANEFAPPRLRSGQAGSPSTSLGAGRLPLDSARGRQVRFHREVEGRGSKVEAPLPSTSQFPASSFQPPASTSLENAQRVNETAASRIIGLTIETRPDYVDAAEITRLRALGVTRVELGVQSLEDAVLERIVRDHGTAEVRHATRLLKDAGFKVAYHLMPNLPGATPESDLESARQIVDDPAYRPDAMKLYPCVVIESAELYQWWREGRYQPYDEETLIELLIRIKHLVPPWVRIERIIRDIPSTSILAGSRITNLREEIQHRMRQRGRWCQCLRCRQVRGPMPGHRPGTFGLVRRAYEASGGTELFLSFEDAERRSVAAFLRLRMSPNTTPPFPTLQGAALVRELHSYGEHLPLHARRDGAAQHRGFGRQLMHEAERISREEFGKSRLAVIAGIGAREYYRALGYALADTYMIKCF